jgi:hypothetical protein
MPGSTKAGEEERRADPGHAERRTGSHGGAAATEGNIVGVDDGIQEQRQDCRRYQTAVSFLMLRVIRKACATLRSHWAGCRAVRHGLYLARDKRIHQEIHIRAKTFIELRALSMATAAIGEKRLRGIVKAALVDDFKENRELMQDIVEDALEDIAVARAIEQGLGTKSVSRKKVFSILESGL